MGDDREADAYYYKAGWMDKKGQGIFGGTKKRWFQMSWSQLYYFPEEQSNPWNYKASTLKEKDKNFEFPSFNFPGLPKFSLPDLPDMPSLSMPDMPSMSMPSMSMPSMSMPSVDLKSLKMPKRKERNESGPYGVINLWGSNGEKVKVKRSGKDLTIIKAKQYRIFKGENENKEGVTFHLTATDEQQAKEWLESFVFVGCEKEK